MSLPKTKSSELIDRLNAYIPGDAIDELTERFLRRESNKLLKVNAVSAYVAIGALECILGNLDACEENHQRSISLQHSSLTLGNYGRSLFCFGEYGRSLDYYKQAYELDKSDLHVLNKYLTAAIDVCQFSLARSLLTAQDKLGLDIQRPDRDIILHLADVADSLGLEDSVTLAICEASHGFIRNAGFYPTYFTHEVIWDGGIPIICHYNSVKATDDELVNMNMEFSSYLVEHVEQLASDKFVLFFDKDD